VCKSRVTAAHPSPIHISRETLFLSSAFILPVAMVEKYQIPVIDEHNPLYCPGVSPNSYLAALHESLSKPNVPVDDVSSSFIRILDQNFFEVDEEDSSYFHQDTRLTVVHPRRLAPRLPTCSPLSWDTRHPPSYPPGLIPSKRDQHTVTPDVVAIHRLKRKRTSSPHTFSDLEGPTKHGRSSESIHESSFDISGKAEKIFGSHFNDRSSALGATYSPILLEGPTADMNHSGNEDNVLLRIRVLEGSFVGLSILLCCYSRPNRVPIVGTG
jgi:hypothetical protein